MRPRYYRLIAGAAGTLFVFFVVMVCWWFGLNPMSSIVLFVGIFLAESLVEQWVSHQLVGRHLVRLRNDLVISSFGVCLRCGDSLDGLPDEHRCPECGIAFRRDEVWALWMRCLKESTHVQLSTEAILMAIREYAVLYKDRKNCIRCGAKLGDGPEPGCEECGASNTVELSEDTWHELM